MQAAEVLDSTQKRHVTRVVRIVGSPVGYDISRQRYERWWDSFPSKFESTFREANSPRRKEKPCSRRRLIPRTIVREIRSLLMRASMQGFLLLLLSEILDL